jgi:hypothetical protein
MRASKQNKGTTLLVAEPITQRWRRFAGCVLVVVATAHAADPPRRLIAPVQPGEIDRLISHLADPSYAERTFATRRLCAIGKRAYSALREAAKSGNAEQALRAQAIVDALDRVMFAGVDVELSLSRAEIAWDQPVDLTVTLTNRSDFPARVPFELDPSERLQTGGDARQVADLIDVAEWLSVTEDNGDALSLHVDDITADPAVGRVVSARVDDAPYSILAPGQRARLVVPSFNRGWARYLLLDRGHYRIVLHYQPEWTDTELKAARVGYAASNTVDLTVTQPAPDTISRRGADVLIELTRDEDAYVVRITNRRDQTVVFNTNLGPAAPFAQGRWVCERDDATRDVTVLPKPVMDISDFDGRLLVPVAAGEAIELTRIDRSDLHKRFKLLGLDPDSQEVILYFSYSNQCDRSWQTRQESDTLSAPKVPPVLREPLPRRVLTGWHTSNRLRLSQSNGGK